jgi:uncharacterized membrane protein
VSGGTRTLGASRATAAALETRIARLLTWGTRIALGLVLVGVLLMLQAGIDPLDHGASPEFSLASIPAQILALLPEGFLWAGLVLVMALPIGRVVVSGTGFLAAGDRRLALVSLLVVVVIVTSIVAALRLGG